MGHRHAADDEFRATAAPYTGDAPANNTGLWGEEGAPDEDRKMTGATRLTKGCCREAVVTAFVMSLNFLSAVGIVMVNKVLFRWGNGLRFATLLTAFHFIATAAGMRICRALGMYEQKPLRQRQVFSITAAFCAFVVFNNLSLQANGVSYYQLMKILTTPAVVVLQLLFYNVVLPTKLALCLVPVCAGVALATAGAEGGSFAGALWATAGLLAAAAYQVLVKSKQAALKVSSFQLLHYQAPQAAALVSILSPLFDDTASMISWAKSFVSSASTSGAQGGRIYGETSREGETVIDSVKVVWIAAMFLLSCVLAFMVNLSLFLVIGRTSPVSYQVLGHFKLVVILAVGIAMFDEHTEPFRLVGMALALTGIIGYTKLKQGLASGWEAQGMASSITPVKDDDSAGKGTGYGVMTRPSITGSSYTMKVH